MDQTFSLLPMPSTMVSMLALARISQMVPNCILTRAVVRSVGVFVLSQLIFNCAQEPMDQSRLKTLPYQWRNSLWSFSWLRGQLGPFPSTRTASAYCAGKNKLTQRTKRGPHVTLWTRPQQALLRHHGTVEISLCKAHITADKFHQFAMTPEILVGNAVADALAKRGANVFPAFNDWGKMDQITWAAQQRIYATSIFAAQAAPRNTTAHPEEVLLAAQRVRKRERTSLENASSHSLVSVGKGISLPCLRALRTCTRCVGLATKHHLLRTAQFSSNHPSSRWTSNAS